MTRIFIKATFILFFIVASLSAQNQNSPWSFSVNSNIINLQEKMSSQGLILEPSLSLSRHFWGGISFGT